jgi:hypothetical protein
MGNEKGIEKTLYLDGEKLKKEQGTARVYGDGGVDVSIYDQKLSKLICERKYLDFPKELTTLSIYYLLEESKVGMKNRIKVVNQKESTSLIFQYTSQSAEWNHSTDRKYFRSMNELAEAIEQGVHPYKDIGIKRGWDDIYNWLVLICEVPIKDETIQSSVTYFLPFINEINAIALRTKG